MAILRTYVTVLHGQRVTVSVYRSECKSAPHVMQAKPSHKNNNNMNLNLDPTATEDPYVYEPRPRITDRYDWEDFDPFEAIEYTDHLEDANEWP